MNFDILRQKILEKAIRGELVPQLESEPAVAQIGEILEEMPFAIPEKWKWLKLDKFSEKRRTVSPDAITGEVELWSIPAYDAGSPERVNSKQIGSSKKEVVNGDVLLSKIVPNIKRAWIVKSNHPHKLASTEWLTFSGKNILDPEFMRQVFLSPYFRGRMMDTISGMGSLKRANPKMLQQVLIPVPPLHEQRRIVAKISQLFEQIDRAEKAHNELSGPLSDRFRQLCLEKAIQGKLVPQLESEPEVEQIGEAPEDVPFAIPEKWKWVLFSDAVKVISSRPFQIKAKEVLEQGLYPVISQSKEQIDGYSNDDKKLIPDSELPIIIFGDHTRALKYVDFRFVVGADGTKLLHVKTSSIDPKYFYIALQSMIGQTRQRGYSRHFQFLKVLHIPIPPIEEQRRIVAKLNELLDSTSQLERTISTP